VSQKKRLTLAQPNIPAFLIIVTIAFAGFQHLSWWVPALAAIIGFSVYQFDKASIGILQLVRDGGPLGGIWYVANLVLLYGIAWLIGYGLSFAF
jgi:hypothetical protein